jgi:hypothetical protein
MWDVQIVRWGCNGADDQKWDITWDSTGGAFTLVSPVSQNCWDSSDAGLGQSLNQDTCSSGSIDAIYQKFYLEYQGYVPNCGGASNRKVRTPLADTIVIACVQPNSL